MLGRFEPERLLVGHGEGVLDNAADEVREALRRAAGLPRVLVRLPGASRQGSQDTSTT
jgi:hypothetical protein